MGHVQRQPLGLRGCLIATAMNQATTHSLPAGGETMRDPLAHSWPGAFPSGP
jgi:hypothetical protein